MREPVFNETVQLGIVVRDLEATGYGGTWTTMGSVRRSSLRVGRTAQNSTHTIYLSVDAPQPVPQYHRRHPNGRTQ
jgi:hypothetical protein